eukprot:GGOE01007978.1.p2 GENE.GGOE01007978.1~~GGOE01007978.1.p2  ORF type:complete len:118 (-),score=4.56 GGOE01007978.1:11-364(-)
MIFIIASTRKDVQWRISLWEAFISQVGVERDFQWFQGYQQCFAVLAIHVVSGKCQEECNLSSNGESGPGAAVLFRLILWTGTAGQIVHLQHGSLISSGEAIIDLATGLSKGLSPNGS